MARYLITGGAGFIGSHLCESFLKLGHEVICMDNYSTGAQENIASFASNPRFRFLDHNVSRFIDIGGALNYIFPFSFPGRPGEYFLTSLPTPKQGTPPTPHPLGLAPGKKAAVFFPPPPTIYGETFVCTH